MTASPKVTVVEIGTEEATLKGDIEYLYTKGQINEGFVVRGQTTSPIKCMNNCGRYIIIDSCVNDADARAFVCGNYKPQEVPKINNPNIPSVYHCGNPCLPDRREVDLRHEMGNLIFRPYPTEIVQLKCDPNCQGECLVDMYVKFIDDFHRSVKRCHDCDRIIYSRIPRSCKQTPLAISELAQECAEFCPRPRFCKQYLKGELDDLPCTSCENLEALDDGHRGMSEFIRNLKAEERVRFFGSYGFQGDVHKCEETCRGECCINAIEEWLASDTKKSSGKR